MTLPKLLIGLVAFFCTIELHVEVVQQAPITQRVIFVVDRSGSMHGDHFTRAIAGFKSCVEFPTDDLEIAVIAFNDATYRWPGKPEEGERSVPAGWAALPSATAVKEAEDWLTQLGAGGNTLVIPALRAALEERRRNLSIILVTDGLFGQERTDDIRALIRRAQAERERLGLGDTVIGVYGLGPSQKVLFEIAEMGRGGYVREQVFEDNPFFDFDGR